MSQLLRIPYETLGFRACLKIRARPGVTDTFLLDHILADLLEVEAGPDRKAKAVKDNTAKAPTYMWDKWTLPFALSSTRTPFLVAELEKWVQIVAGSNASVLEAELTPGFRAIPSAEGMWEPSNSRGGLFAARGCFVRIGSCSVWE